MQSLLKFAAWFKTYGVILVWSLFAALFLLCGVLVYRTIDEVLGIAQRGYFISVPALKPRFGNRERELKDLRERFQPKHDE